MCIRDRNDVGIDLSGYRYDEDSKHLFTQRTINGKVYELTFEAESDGTKKMIAALPVLMVALQEGRTVAVSYTHLYDFKCGCLDR